MWMHFTSFKIFKKRREIWSSALKWGILLNATVLIKLQQCYIYNNPEHGACITHEIYHLSSLILLEVTLHLFLKFFDSLNWILPQCMLKWKLTLKRDQTIFQPHWKLLPGNNGEEIFSEAWPPEQQQPHGSHTVLEAGFITLHPWLKPQRESWTRPMSCLQRI